MAEHLTPLQVLIAAKLSGTNAKLGDGEWGYRFRTNEQAAAFAIEALGKAGYEIRRKAR